MFLLSSHILTLSHRHLYILFTFPVCGASHHHPKKITSCSCSSSPSSPLRLSGIYCRSSLWVSGCAVVSHGIVGCSDQYWLLLFFLRFWLMLGTASPWVGSEFCRLWCCLPGRWLSVDSLCSSWFSILVIWLLLSFIARGRLHNFLISFCLPFPLCSLILLQLSSLLASLVTLLFSMFSTSGLDSVFLCVCLMGFEGCLCSQAWAMLSRWLALILPSSCCFSSSPASLSIGVRN